VLIPIFRGLDPQFVPRYRLGNLVSCPPGPSRARGGRGESLPSHSTFTQQPAPGPHALDKRNTAITHLPQSFWKSYNMGEGVGVSPGPPKFPNLKRRMLLGIIKVHVNGHVSAITLGAVLALYMTSICVYNHPLQAPQSPSTDLGLTGVR